MSDVLFDYLLVGLDKLQRQQSYYPYPPELVLAMNQLANLQEGRYPKTFPAFLTELEQPVSDWFPHVEQLPAGIIPDAPLLYRGQLDDMAIQYLDNRALQQTTSLTDMRSAQENQLMVDLIARARNDYARAETPDEMRAVEKAYADARRFLVEHPFTSWQKLKQSLRRNRYQAHIEDMYNRVESVHYLAREGKKLLVCNRCGPIQETVSGRQDSLKPSACRGRCPTRTGWDRIPADANMFVLKRAIQERTMIPGKAEIELYTALQGLMASQQETILTQVRLYPAVDQYDLQLRFELTSRNGDIEEVVWAVDVKDYRLPDVLGREIKLKLDDSIEKAFPDYLPNLVWQRAFYIVPDYREVARDGYCDALRLACESDRFQNLTVMTSGEFIQHVKKVIWEHSDV